MGEKEGFVSQHHYGYIAAANGTFTVDGECHLHRIIVGTSATSGVVTVYDGEDTSGTVVAAFDGNVEGNYNFGCLRLSALHVKVTGGNSQTTIIYS